MFIAMSAVTVVVFDISFIFERYLRHSGRLAPNTSTWQKVLSLLTIFFSICGAAGLILLTIFDTLHHHNLHDGFLVLFIAGYVLTAICCCWEYQRLGIHYRQHKILRVSFWVKLAFIIIEVGLAIGQLMLIHVNLGTTNRLQDSVSKIRGKGGIRQPFWNGSSRLCTRSSSFRSSWISSPPSARNITKVAKPKIRWL